MMEDDGGNLVIDDHSSSSPLRRTNGGTAGSRVRVKRWKVDVGSRVWAYAQAARTKADCFRMFGTGSHKSTVCGTVVARAIGSRRTVEVKWDDGVNTSVGTRILMMDNSNNNNRIEDTELMYREQHQHQHQLHVQQHDEEHGASKGNNNTNSGLVISGSNISGQFSRLKVDVGTHVVAACRNVVKKAEGFQLYGEEYLNKEIQGVVVGREGGNRRSVRVRWFYNNSITSIGCRLVTPLLPPMMDSAGGIATAVNSGADQQFVYETHQHIPQPMDEHNHHPVGRIGDDMHRQVVVVDDDEEEEHRQHQHVNQHGVDAAMDEQDLRDNQEQHSQNHDDGLDEQQHQQLLESDQQQHSQNEQTHEQQDNEEQTRRQVDHIRNLDNDRHNDDNDDERQEYEAALLQQQQQQHEANDNDTREMSAVEQAPHITHTHELEPHNLVSGQDIDGGHEHNNDQMYEQIEHGELVRSDVDVVNDENEIQTQDIMVESQDDNDSHIGLQQTNHDQHELHHQQQHDQQQQQQQQQQQHQQQNSNADDRTMNVQEQIMNEDDHPDTMQQIHQTNVPSAPTNSNTRAEKATPLIGLSSTNPRHTRYKFDVGNKVCALAKCLMPRHECESQFGPEEWNTKVLIGTVVERPPEKPRSARIKWDLNESVSMVGVRKLAYLGQEPTADLRKRRIAQHNAQDENQNNISELTSTRRPENINGPVGDNGSFNGSLAGRNGNGTNIEQFHSRTQYVGDSGSGVFNGSNDDYNNNSSARMQGNVDHDSSNSLATSVQGSVVVAGVNEQIPGEQLPLSSLSSTVRVARGSATKRPRSSSVDGCDDGRGGFRPFGTQTAIAASSSSSDPPRGYKMATGATVEATAERVRTRAECERLLASHAIAHDKSRIRGVMIGRTENKRRSVDVKWNVDGVVTSVGSKVLTVVSGVSEVIVAATENMLEGMQQQQHQQQEEEEGKLVNCGPDVAADVGVDTGVDVGVDDGDTDVGGEETGEEVDHQQQQDMHVSADGGDDIEGMHSSASRVVDGMVTMTGERDNGDGGEEEEQQQQQEQGERWQTQLSDGVDVNINSGENDMDVVESQTNGSSALSQSFERQVVVAAQQQQDEEDLSQQQQQHQQRKQEELRQQQQQQQLVPVEQQQQEEQQQQLQQREGDDDSLSSEQQHGSHIESKYHENHISRHDNDNESNSDEHQMGRVNHEGGSTDVPDVNTVFNVDGNTEKLVQFAASNALIPERKVDGIDSGGDESVGHESMDDIGWEES